MKWFEWVLSVMKLRNLMKQFIVGMSFMKSLSDLESYCVKFLDGLSKVGGPVALAAKTMYDEWTEAGEGQLLFDCLAKEPKIHNFIIILKKFG